MNTEGNGDERTPSLPARQTVGREPVLSNQPSHSFGGAISESVNLIDDSARHLFELMSNIEIDPEKDGADIMTAVEVAKQIANLARVKLDFVKAMK